MKIIAYIKNSKSEIVQSQIESTLTYGYDRLELSNPKEKKLTELMNLVETMDSGDVLVVKSLSCFDLRTKGLYEFITKILKEDKHFHAIDEAIDSRESSGKGFYRSLKAIYEMERQVISARTTEAILEARKEGVHVGRPSIDQEKIQEILNLYKTSRISMRKISQITGVSVGSVSKYVRSQ